MEEIKRPRVIVYNGDDPETFSEECKDALVIYNNMVYFNGSSTGVSSTDLSGMLKTINGVSIVNDDGEETISIRQADTKYRFTVNLSSELIITSGSYYTFDNSWEEFDSEELAAFLSYSNNDLLGEAAAQEYDCEVTVSGNKYAGKFTLYSEQIDNQATFFQELRFNNQIYKRVWIEAASVADYGGIWSAWAKLHQISMSFDSFNSTGTVEFSTVNSLFTSGTYPIEVSLTVAGTSLSCPGTLTVQGNSSDCVHHFLLDGAFYLLDAPQRITRVYSSGAWGNPTIKTVAVIDDEVSSPVQEYFTYSADKINKQISAAIEGNKTYSIDFGTNIVSVTDVNMFNASYVTEINAYNATDLHYYIVNQSGGSSKSISTAGTITASGNNFTWEGSISVPKGAIIIWAITRKTSGSNAAIGIKMISQ